VGSSSNDFSFPPLSPPSFSHLSLPHPYAQFPLNPIPNSILPHPSHLCTPLPFPPSAIHSLSPTHPLLPVTFPVFHFYPVPYWPRLLASRRSLLIGWWICFCCCCCVLASFLSDLPGSHLPHSDLDAVRGLRRWFTETPWTHSPTQRLFHRS